MQKRRSRRPRKTIEQKRKTETRKKLKGKGDTKTWKSYKSMNIQWVLKTSPLRIEKRLKRHSEDT
jgi:hypothetical protein